VENLPGGTVERLGCNEADPLDRRMERGISVQRSVNSALVVVGGKLGKQPAQVALPEHDHVVEAFPADRADPSICVCILPRRTRRNTLVAERLHSRVHDAQVFLYAFDLLELDGEDWRPRPLAERKARLSKLIAKAPAGLRYNEHLEGDGATIFAHACKLGLEGVVSKHREHPYRSGRSKAWLKVKNPAAPGVLRFKNHEP
jgi:hypothetical protein